MSVMPTVSSKWNVGFQAQEQLRTVLLTEWKAANVTRVGTLYSRNVMDMDWGLVVKLALSAKVTRRANKVIEIYDRSH
jgi:hypothetical protein